MSILHLQYIRPDGESEVFHLKPVRRYIIGRGSTCELRILDMKMSRQHCAVEAAGPDWQLVDLGSTNGCHLNGERVEGSATLSVGQRITAGATTLLVLAINDTLEYAPEDQPERMQDLVSTVPVRPGFPEQETMPESGDHIPVVQTDNSWEAEPDADLLNKTGALIETRKHAQVTVAAVDVPATTSDASPASAVPEPAVVPAPAVVAPTPMAAPAVAEAMMTVTLLGQRIGPIPRSMARDLKARELKGTLTAAHLADLPRA